jgi:hypothetical protein
MSRSSLADLTRFDSVAGSWRYCQTIRETWECVLRDLENIFQSVYSSCIQLYWCRW